MANQKSIGEIITIGDASIYLSGNDYANGSLFGTKLIKSTTPVLIAYVTDALRWQFEGNPSDTSLRGVGNYLIWLCGVYGAQTVAAQGGGSVIPITPATTPAPLYFYVSDSTPVKTGESAVSFPGYIGYNLQFDRGNLPQMQASNGFDTYYSWDKNTGIFQCFGAANEGEPFSLIPYV